ncbi:Protein-disulfide isomerase [Octadecabacter temperatus]|uniref:Disulfide bond formation protein D n=1 Tax=Octadecabacter temperatus TaxID=1458307 RepID=A0A0K0Y5P6_9RHOB|nr:DsbA family protein [Octadecabacter temperatus]AKS46274.1 Disulfide bond formation protein D precursor [Octadecabacter temperatus]SIO11017.1 Protein-disulfide isomerase [Octadecabacter temperatus]
MRLTSTFAALMMTASSVFAQDTMSDSERTEFRAEVRAYLLENPEVLMEAIAVLETRQAQAEVLRDDQLVATNMTALVDDGFSYVGGNPDGDVTIIEFTDYRCGFCRRAHPEVAELIETDGNIRIITKEFPILGEQSVIASQFAVATKIVAGDEAYKLVSDALINMRSDVTPASLSALASAFDLDGDAIMAEMESDAVREVLANNRALGDRMQISGTPTFVFGEQLVRGYVDLAQMRKIISEEREDS